MLAVLLIVVAPNNYRGYNILVGGLTKERWFGFVARNISLVPLRGIIEQLGDIIAGQDLVRNITYLVGNIVGFMPLGFFLPTLFVRQRRFLPFLLTVLVSITVLELTQVLTMCGSFDIDDITLNTVGACLGFGITRKCIWRIAGLPVNRSRCNM